MNWDGYECEGQMSLMDWLNQDKEKLTIHKNLRLIEAFCGVGSQAMSLRDLGIKFEHWRAYDIDSFAIKSYNAIHGTSFEPTDISEVKGSDLGIVDRVNNTYLLTYSFPCTDLSISGLQKGMAEGSGTRSSLLWQIKRILEECGSELPQILLMENVPMIHNAKNKPQFMKWLSFLESKGYTTVWEDLQAKDYGIPQSRNRTIAVSFLGNYKYRFPKPIPLMLKMKDFLELSVEDKFYMYTDKAWQMIDDLIREGRLPKETLEALNKGGVERMTMECEGFSSLKNTPTGKQVEICPTLTARDYKGMNNYGQGGVVEAVRLTDYFRDDAKAETTDICPTLMARDFKGLNNHGIGGAIECIRLGGLNGKGQAGSIYSPEGCSPTLVSGMSHWTNVPNIIECEKVICAIRGRSKSNPSYRGVIDQDDYSARLEPNSEGISNALTTVDMDNMVLEISSAKDLSRWVWEIDGEKYLIRLRRLTPRESWRLMGFTDEDFEKASAVCSNTQLFKQAGNSIVKQVLMRVFLKMMEVE